MQHRQNHRRHAFTMIELLVTIGIILILVGLVFVAIKHASGACQIKCNAELP